MRLTKQFFKAARIYGAESYIKGFSGYVCEILTIYYGSFLKLIKSISKWEEKTVIDINNYYKGKNVFMELNKSKLTSPLIVIDPVQKDRNAAAALEHEKFEILIHLAREFLKKPSTEYFEIKPITEQNIKKKAGKYKSIIMEAKSLNKKEDVAGAKMLKAFHFIEQKLISYGFKLIESDMIWNHRKNSLFYYILEKDKLPKIVEVSGPPLKLKRHVEMFKKKHKTTFVRGKRIYTLEKRKFTDAKSLVKKLVQSDNVKGNLKKVDLV